MYQILILNVDNLDVAKIAPLLKNQCNFTKVSYIRQVLEFCTLHKPALLVGSLEADDELLRLAAHLRSLQWTLPLVAFVGPKTSIPSLRAAESLGITQLQANSPELLPFIRHLLYLDMPE